MPPLPTRSLGTAAAGTVTVGAAARAGLLALAAARLARGARRQPTLVPAPARAATAEVTAVVPARDEAGRIGPCVASLVADGVDVLVVDDGSTDDTAPVAARAGATVVDAGPLPEGWAGKAHALQVGLEAATAPVVLCLDADCRVAPGAAAALVAALRARDGQVLVSAGTRVDVPSALGRAVHASMLATLVYRFGPPGVPASRPARTMANGQCMVVDRHAVLARGGMAPVAGSLTEDVALARHLASEAGRVAFLDGTRLVTVEGYGGALATLAGWGRSLSLAEVTSTPWMLADLAVVWSAMALPMPRVLAGRGDLVDATAIALRLGTAAATAGAFRQRGAALALAPLADLPVAVALTAGALRPSRRWRGRDYR